MNSRLASTLIHSTLGQSQVVAVSVPSSSTPPRILNPLIQHRSNFTKEASREIQLIKEQDRTKVARIISRH